MSFIKDALLKIVDDFREAEKTSDWAESSFAPVREALAIDRKGQIGQLFVEKLLQERHEVHFNPKTRRIRHYHMKVDGIKLQVRFATRGTEYPSFQHERLFRERDWDALIVIDVAPEKIYVQMTAHQDLPWDTLHFRSEGYYKYDLMVEDHEQQGNEVSTTDEFLEKFRILKQRVMELRGD